MTANAEAPRILSLHDHLSLCGPQYLSAVSGYTFPILIGGRFPGNFELVGSGIAVSKNRQNYLVTAEHVVREILGPRGRDVYIGTGSVAEPGSVHLLPAAGATAWRFHEKPELDLAAAPLTLPIASLRFLDISQITQGYVAGMPGHYFLAGYPLSKNKARDVNQPDGQKSTGIASIVVKTDQSLNFTKDRKNPNEYLGFKYDRVHEDGKLKIQGTHPRGLSGCGLWYFPTQGLTASFYLAGIFIEWHKRSKQGYATFAKYLPDILD